MTFNSITGNNNYTSNSLPCKLLNYKFVIKHTQHVATDVTYQESQTTEKSRSLKALKDRLVGLALFVPVLWHRLPTAGKWCSIDAMEEADSRHELFGWSTATTLYTTNVNVHRTALLTSVLSRRLKHSEKDGALLFHQFAVLTPVQVKHWSRKIQGQRALWQHIVLAYIY